MGFPGSKPTRPPKATIREADEPALSREGRSRSGPDALGSKRCAALGSLAARPWRRRAGGPRLRSGLHALASPRGSPAQGARGAPPRTTGSRSRNPLPDARQRTCSAASGEVPRSSLSSGSIPTARGLRRAEAPERTERRLWARGTSAHAQHRPRAPAQPAGLHARPGGARAPGLGVRGLLGGPGLPPTPRSGSPLLDLALAPAPGLKVLHAPIALLARPETRACAWKSQRRRVTGGQRGAGGRVERAGRRCPSSPRPQRLALAWFGLAQTSPLSLPLSPAVISSVGRSLGTMPVFVVAQPATDPWDKPLRRKSSCPVPHRGRQQWSPGVCHRAEGRGRRTIRGRGSGSGEAAMRSRREHSSGPRSSVWPGLRSASGFLGTARLKRGGMQSPGALQLA